MCLCKQDDRGDITVLCGAHAEYLRARTDEIAECMRQQAQELENYKLERAQVKGFPNATAGRPTEAQIEDKARLLGWKVHKCPWCGETWAGL